MSVTVDPVHTAADRRTFPNLPDRLHRRDPQWIFPLRSEAAAAWDTKRNPFYRHADLELFLARRDGRAVGRIGAIRNHAHDEFHGERVGFFGFFETEDRQETADALLAAVAAWHRERGATELRGPVSPSMGSECGLLVEGFDSPPVILMPYNPPSYVELLERAGFRKEIDLLAFDISRESHPDIQDRLDRLRGLIRRLERRHPGLSIRPLDKRSLRRDAQILRDVFDGARAENYGFVPSTEEEYDALVAKLAQIVDPSIVLILEDEGTPVGCVIALPDWNRALHSSRGWPGPLRLLKILRDGRRLDSIRVLAIAVAPHLKRSGVLAWLLLRVVENGMDRGYRRAELSWVAEDNEVQLRTLASVFDPNPYKRYRIYRRSLDA